MRCLWAVALLLLGSLANAQPEPPIVDDKVIFSMTLTPSAAPKPVSRSYLLPEYRELQPGSKVQGFLKCFMEQQVFFGAEQEQRREKFNEMKLQDLPKDVRQQCGIYDGIAYDTPNTRLMGYMDRAARYTRTEWNEWFDIRKDGIYFLIPELQKLRAISAVLRLRMRGEVRNGEFDRAIVTARTMFGLAQMLEEHPTLIGNLVGNAIATQCLNVLEEMIQQPGCPNLYWAFVDLRKPLIHTRFGLSGERLLLTSTIEEYTKAKRVLTEAELEIVFKYVEDITRFSGESKPAVEKFLSTPRVRYALFASDFKRVEKARQLMVQNGIPAEVAKVIPPIQVILYEDLLQYEILRDELMKWCNVPYRYAVEGFASETKKISSIKNEFILAPQVIGAVDKVQSAQARTEQRVAFLTTLEAIRMHAYNNNHQLPEKLNEIKLPIPEDPINGKPFRYQVQDGVAKLSGGNPHPGNARTNRVYELKLAKK